MSLPSRLATSFLVIGLVGCATGSPARLPASQSPVADPLGLCVLYSPEQQMPHGKFPTLQTAYAPAQLCTKERASEIGLDVSDFEELGRKKTRTVTFLPVAPLDSTPANMERCSLSHAPVEVGGKTLVFDRHFRSDPDDAADAAPRMGLVTRRSVAQQAIDGQVMEAARIHIFELIALAEYMGGSYKAMNQGLRGLAPLSTQDAARVKLTASALAKLLNHGFSVNTGITVRKVKLTDDLISQLYPEGQCIYDRGFTSASDDPAPNDYPSTFGSIPVVIFTKQVAKVEALANEKFKLEREVIFPPGTVFRVLKVMENPVNPYAKKIYLEQCPCPP